MMGLDFPKTLIWTLKEYVKAEEKCWMRQGRRPGDWVIHETADKALERHLVDNGCHGVVAAAYMEFVEHERAKYADE